MVPGADPGEVFRVLDEHTVELNLPSRIGYERVAMECSAAFARIAGFPPDRIEDLKTAVSEACLNAMEHGNKCQAGTRVKVTINFASDTLTVFVIDEGDGISQIPDDHDIEQKIEQLQPPRGLGIFLIRHLVDHVEFNRVTEEGHVVRMVIEMRQVPRRD